MKRIILIGLVALALVGGYWYIATNTALVSDSTDQRGGQVETDADGVSTGTDAAANPVPPVTDYRDLSVQAATLTPVASGLDAPWAFAWLPDGDVLVSERFGTLRLVRDGVVSAPIAGVPDVLAAGQGGLLDVTIHPEFAVNRLVYLSYAHGTNEANRLRVARAELVGESLQNLEVIFTVNETKTGAQHFGSRFAWLPDGTLLFSVGDGGNPPTQYAGALIREQAQNLSAHLGKIIRINDDGSIPEDNPFIGRPDALPEIYSYGHRNVQGIAFDAVGNRVIVSEHGSKGGDELNAIAPGANYGWPVTSFATEYDAFSSEISPDQTLPGVTNPLAVWTPTIAPSTVVAYDGGRYNLADDNTLFLSGMLLRSNTTIAAYATRPAGSIFMLTTDDAGAVTRQERITVGDVRVRSLGQGPDGYLYVLTDTTGRQTRPGTNDGALYRVESF